MTTNINILLVEDNLPLAKSTAKLLERLSGYTVTVTDEPQTISELCTAGKVDIILMDINIPGAFWAGKEVSGSDLAYVLKTQPKTAHIPIILLTAYAMESEKASLLAKSKADEFFTKPISDYAALIKAIARLTYH